ncbi:hypothetical protein D3C78_1016110 [compost metagenome]
MAQRDGATIGIDLRRVVGQAQFAQHRQALAGEGFVELDDIEITHRHTEALGQLAYRRYRTDAHDPRRNTGAGHAEDPGTWGQAVFFHCFSRGQDQCRGTVVDPRGIACGDGLVRAIDRLQAGQGFQGGIGAWMLVVLDNGFAFFVGDAHRHDLFSEETCGLGGCGTLLATQGEGVLIGTRDLVIVGDVVGGLRHGIDAVLGFHQRVDEAPADGGVFELHVARKSGIGLAHHERRTGHRLDAAGNRQLHLAAGDGAKGGADSVHARGAEAVQGHTRHAVRQACQQQRHARDVAVVFAGLVGAAEEHLVQQIPLHLRVALDQRLDRYGGQVIGTHAGQGAAEAADGGTNGIADKYVTHQASPGAWPWAAAVRASRSRRALSSTSLGSAVVCTLSAKRIAQPVAAMICSRVTPGWIEVTTNS